MTFSFHRKNVPTVSWSWREGKYWDFWMFVHLWSGVTLASVIPFFALPDDLAIGLAFLGIVGWEFLEYFFDIHEVIENRVIDIIFGLAGLLGVHRYIIPKIPELWLGWFFLGVLIVLVVLCVAGWRAYRRRIGEQLAGDLV